MSATHVVIHLHLCFCSLDETLGDYYYFNFETGETQWDHPLDRVYRQKVIEARDNLIKGADKAAKVESSNCQSESKTPSTYLDSNHAECKAINGSKLSSIAGDGRNSLETVTTTKNSDNKYSSRSNSTESENMELAQNKLVRIHKIKMPISLAEGNI